VCAEVTVKQLKEKIKELDERLESTAQVQYYNLLFNYSLISNALH